ncbi:TLC domain-containing protein At5g14285-like [Phalaenopsis equestris]|uniref:TLC domain-containing protein At5g14285-like n=1 Tax=Phalaenopsis equestris TaxID=78828 RepID=UPI0009E5C9C7|nr:TLC domain-containing protein At5g14285-like [Phalaenopsis equestris]
MKETTMETLIPLISGFPSFFALFSIIYLIGYSLVFRTWHPKPRLDASSCLISLAHGTPAVFLAISSLLANPSSFASPNSDFQNLVLDFSIAYFAVDLLHLFIFFPADFLFIAHHLATLFVFVTCRYLVRHGAFSILVLLVLAELTSAFQNIWTLAGLRREEFPMAENVHRILSPPFFALYSIMRGLLGPLFFLKMSMFYLSGAADDVISRWILVSWIVVVGGAILVSIIWITNHWMKLFRERKTVSDKKGY